MADELDLARSVVKLRTALERYMVGMEQRAMQDPDPIALVHTADVAKDIRLILGGFEPGLMWPRTWSLPPEPGAEVTAVTDSGELGGRTWVRHYAPAPDGRHWWYPADGDPEEDGTDWDELVAVAWPGKLTDATETGADHAR